MHFLQFQPHRHWGPNPLCPWTIFNDLPESSLKSRLNSCKIRETSGPHLISLSIYSFVSFRIKRNVIILDMNINTLCGRLQQRLIDFFYSGCQWIAKPCVHKIQIFCSDIYTHLKVIGKRCGSNCTNYNDLNPISRHPLRPLGSVNLHLTKCHPHSISAT